MFVKKLVSLSALTLLGAAFSLPAAAADDRAFVGDATNGRALYKKHCASCHGKDGKGGRSGVDLSDSGRMTLLTDDQVFGVLQMGKGLEKSKEHTFKKEISFLDTWDLIQDLRLRHLELHAFFPHASRYVAKTYTIDKHGLKRIKELTKKAAIDKTSPVFTFFDMEGEEGHLTYVPQDPIRLDQLKKKFKAGYLVFVDFKTSGFSGQLGVAMDPEGKITKLLVHDSAKKADLLNKSLSRFEGMGKKGLTEPFKIGGGGAFKTLAHDLFPAYLAAMETVTMYDREENERTWADQD